MGLFKSALNFVSGAFGGPSFGAKEKEYPQVQKSEIDLVKLRDSAVKAGFNPLTVLNSVGSSFSTITMPSVFKTVQPTAFKFGQLSKAMGDRAMQVMSFGQGFHQNAAQIDLMGAQASSLNAQTYKPVGLGGTKAARAAANFTTPGGNLAPSQGTFELSTVTNPFPLGSGIVVEADTPDAEMGETRYSDMGGAWFGIQAIRADAKANNEQTPFLDGINWLGERAWRASDRWRARGQAISDWYDAGSVQHAKPGWLTDKVGKGHF